MCYGRCGVGVLVYSRVHGILSVVESCPELSSNLQRHSRDGVGAQGKRRTRDNVILKRDAVFP